MADQIPPPPAPPAVPQYGAPQPPQPPGYRSTNGMAIAALVCGILGLTLFFGIGSILALIFGYVGKGQIDRSQGTQEGRGLAVAGIVMGWIGVALCLLFVLLIVIGFIAAFSGSGSEIELQDEIQIRDAFGASRAILLACLQP